MKWLLSLTILMSFQLKAEVSPDHVDTMIDQMVSNNVISKVEAEKAKVRMRTMSPEQWGQINTQAGKIAAARGPASVAASENKIEEVKGVDLDSAQFKQIQSDIGKIVPQYKD
jgi:hypothetical protein